MTSVGYAQPATALIQAHIDGPQVIDASGEGSVSLTIGLWDIDARPCPKGTAVRALILRGDARLSSGLSSDLTVDDRGSIALQIFPGTRVGPLVIRLNVGDATTSIELTLTADMREPLVVGFATGGIGPVLSAQRNAMSLFGTGELARNTRGTFSYDSSYPLDQTTAADPFLDNSNDRPFPTYGDGSVRYDEALSRNHVFASIQNGRSSATWGEFYASAAPSSAAGGYDVLVNGARLAIGGNVVGGQAFTARNDIAYARAVITPTGLAVASQALHSSIVIGSDVLTLVHLDRRTGAILAQSIMGRGSDYVVDYQTGLLRFLNIVLPYDDAFNPQIVVVRYAYGGPGAVSTMLGGSATVNLGAGGRADAWYLNDALGSGNLTLLGESVNGATSNGAWSVSREHSQGVLPSANPQYGADGDAYRAAFNTHTSGLRLDIAFAGADAAYDNPFGSYTVPGLTSLNVVAGLRLSPRSELELSYLTARNELPVSMLTPAVNNSDEATALTLRVAPSARLKYRLGVRSDAASSNGAIDPVLFAAGGIQAPNAPGSFENFMPTFAAVSYTAGSGHSLDAESGVDWRFAPRAAIALSRSQPLRGGVDPYDPPQTRAELDLDIGPNGKAFIRQLWQQDASTSLAASQAGQTYASTAQSQSSIGFEEQTGPATYQTGYAVDHTAGGTDLFDAIGVRTRLIATERLKADGFLQLGDSLYSTYGTPKSSPFFTAFGTSLDYSLATFHATGQVQVRGGFDSGSTFGLGVTGPLSPAVSLFGSYNASHTENVVDEEGRGGLAYRPSRNDRYVTLLSVDAYRTNLTDYDAYVTNVAQIQELYRSSTRTEWAASDAYKLTGDAFFAPHTAILGLRGDQRIGSRFDIASEAHWSDVAPISGTSATGFALEAGYRLGSSMRLAGGYNFVGFADPQSAVKPSHRGAYVTFSTYIDRIFGWGNGH